MHPPGISVPWRSPSVCIRCGTPVDSEYFDDSSIEAAPGAGEEAVLAKFELPAQYCGVLEFVAQFTDVQAANPAQIETPGLEWLLLANNQPLYPYLGLRFILNPWGVGSFPIALRLNDGATIEFIVRGTSGAPPPGDPLHITKVGGRIIGRYWYNPEFGHAGRRCDL
jgi:hypothetical protein